jgi:Tfp pilus assembly protein PilO
MKSSNRLIIAMLVVAALATGFWILILSPKREEASELGTEVEQLRSTLALAQSQAAEATAARGAFPEDYRKLVVLGKAVPGDDETSSLLLQMTRVADRSQVRFESIQLSSSAEGTAAASSSAPQAGPSTPVTETTPATEAAAALLPLGASVGPDGLAVMPYNVNFTGSFFHVADFIHGIDSLVETGTSQVAVDGRLVTLDGFVLSPAEEEGVSSSTLNANFAVTTYLVPPGQGVTAGATLAAPAAVEAESATGTPSSFSTEETPAQ